ncbi:F-box protein At2g26850-like [Vigna radiata var. radiata]|uniref:F-box protein At2g26850-like n=1 Tax=Vigna radiata var. radiata TaxID=3916 RepID=A0A1S3TB98_VIGRR|nr:F-box protein At2g26850-like [Vigna radiata var. radiata]
MDVIGPRGSISLLHIPEPILERILKLLSPQELVRMSEVCTCLRDNCRSDSLWEVHIKQKWGGVIGDVAFKEWQWHITAAKEKELNQLNKEINQKGSLGPFNGTWPMLYLRSYLEDCSHLNSSLSKSLMALFFSLENGKFWFPAQVFMGVFVRDALLRYDSKTDNFQARLQSGGWHIMATNVQWDKVRAPPVDTLPYVRYVSDCLPELKPGDHIEIQRRYRRETSYDWCYAIIGHMDSCNENENLCSCGHSDTLMLEFKQYSEGSRMRRVKLERNGEEYEEASGCYGGIRKLRSEEEIQRWEKHVPLRRTTVNIPLHGFNNVLH